ncbi:MAG: class I SAM-dependent methyltransferase [Verrucomicrobiae bacterium]|nr:class I SAM-dependent methyltransferase [Verrucomicrobiae bacterium]
MPPENTLYRQAALYRSQYATSAKDLRFYQRLARESHGPVLELGMGTGRITAALLETGCQVVGLDISPDMLKEARKQGAAVPMAFCGDFLAFALKCRFNLVLCGFNSFQHILSRKDFAQMLACVKKHLHPNGVFAFDLPHIEPENLQTPSPTPTLRERFFDEDTSQPCEVWESFDYHPTSQIKQCAWEYRWANGRQRRETLLFRVYFPSETLALLDEGGFRVLQHLGGFEGSPFSRVSTRQIFICQPL